MKHVKFRRKLFQKLARTTTASLRDLWTLDPLAAKPRATKEEYLQKFEHARQVSHPEVDAFERQTGVTIDRVFLDDLALHTQVTAKGSALAWAHGRVLYSALTEYVKRLPAGNATDRLTILETGTARGFSSLCMAKALSDTKRAGTILTTDILPNDVPIFWNCIDDLEGKKTRQELLRPWRELTERYVVFLSGDSASLLPSISVDRIHFAYLDGGHTYEDVMAEYARIGPRQLPGDVIVFDDVTPAQFPGIVKAVEEICATGGYSGKTINAGERRAYVVATKA
jgi:predicted O-methyltransferase YrrM